MPWGGTLRGVKEVRAKFDEMRDLTIPQTVDAALQMATRVVIAKAREILDYDVYSSMKFGDEELTHRLYRSFIASRVEWVGDTATRQIRNTAPYAIWIEHGSQEHFIGPNDPTEALRWFDHGRKRFSSGHVVSGIKGIHFMERALEESKDEVLEIFKQAFRSIGEDVNLRITSDSLAYSDAISQDAPFGGDYDIEL